MLVTDKGKPDYVWIPAVPIVLFLLLGSHYLPLMRQFRYVYNDFIRKLHFCNATVDDVFFIAPRVGIRASSWSIFRLAAQLRHGPSISCLVSCLWSCGYGGFEVSPRPTPLDGGPQGKATSARFHRCGNSSPIRLCG